MREGQGDRYLLIVLVMATLWNSFLLLNTQRELANTNAQVGISASSAKAGEQSRQALEQDLNEELKWFEKAMTRNGEVGACEKPALTLDNDASRFAGCGSGVESR